MMMSFYLNAPRLMLALVRARPHVNRLVDDALIGLTDDDGIPLFAE